MPKRLMIALVLAALAVAACHSSGTSSVPSGPAGSPSPNPNVHLATIQVTINGTPQPNIPVAASTPANVGSPRPGKPFQTKDTGMKGLVRFTHLNVNKTYCWVAHFGSGVTSSLCGNWVIWQSSKIVLGTGP